MRKLRVALGDTSYDVIASKAPCQELSTVLPDGPRS